MTINSSGWPTLDVSPFHNVEPIGIGTQLVESLSSYVVRLAEEHFVSTSDMAVYGIGPHLSHVRLRSDSAVIGSHKSVSLMNGNSPIAVEWVSTLEKLTPRNDLKRLSLLPFAHLFSDKESLKLSRSWCPSCLDEWQVKKLTIYEPLLWCIKAIKICPVHHEPLVSNCPYCGSSSLVLAPRTLPGYCAHCERWLGYSTNSPQAPENIEDQIWVTQELGELLTQGTLDNISTNRTIPAVLNFLITKRVKRDGILSVAKLIEIHPNTLRQWLLGERLPILKDLLTLCRVFKLNLVELDSQAISWEKYGGFDEKVAEIVNEKSLNKSKTDWMEIEKLLCDIIHGNVAPKRVSDIVRTYGCVSEHLYSRYSDLCKAVTAMHAGTAKSTKFE